MAIYRQRYAEAFEEAYAKTGDEAKAHKYALEKSEIGHKAAVKNVENFWSRIKKQRKKGMKEQPKRKEYKTTRTKYVERNLEQAGISQSEINKLKGK